MGIWYDGKLESRSDNFSFISVREQLGRCTIGLTPPLYTSGFLYQYSIDAADILLAIDGTIENLLVLAEQLNIFTTDISKIITALYLCEGDEGLYRIQGAVSLILYDLRLDKTILYRAFLGGYPLYFARKNSRLTVSTNPVYLLRRSDLSGRIDEAKIAKLFAINPSKWSGTVFSDIDEVEHGELITISPRGVDRKKQPLHKIFQKKTSFQDEKKTIDIYRSLLEASINKTIKPGKKYGIMLSSGMDSTSIAYFAAKKLHEEGRELTAYSWTLPGDSADESEKIKLLCRKLDIPLKMFNGERFGPFDRLDDLFLLPNTPFVNSFWPINQECYRRAGEDGIDLLFNGGYGDMLFRPRSSQLKGIWEDKRFDLLFTLLKQKGFFGLLKAVMHRLSPWKKSMQPEKPSMSWLTDTAERLTGQDLTTLPESGFEHFQSALSSFFADYLGGERYLSEPYGLQRIEPHKDPDLLNFSMGFPPYMTYRNGQTKYFAREAMRGLLPEDILTQPRVGSLISFSTKSFLRNRVKVHAKVMEEPSLWNFYIKEEWMEEKLAEGAAIDNKDLFVIRRCIDLAAWQKAIKPGGSLYESKYIH